MAANGGCSGWPDGERTSAKCSGATSTLVHQWGGHPTTLEIQYLGPQQGTDGHGEAEGHKLRVGPQGCHSEFGSNKVRKMVRQGKEKRLLARIFKILGKARKRLSRQNSTIKVRKCEEKRPEFTKKARKRLSRQNSTRKVRKCEEK